MPDVANTGEAAAAGQGSGEFSPVPGAVDAGSEAAPVPDTQEVPPLVIPANPPGTPAVTPGAPYVPAETPSADPVPLEQAAGCV